VCKDLRRGVIVDMIKEEQFYCVGSVGKNTEVDATILWRGT
jgi:hypothetical protein